MPTAVTIQPAEIEEKALGLTLVVCGTDTSTLMTWWRTWKYVFAPSRSLQACSYLPSTSASCQQTTQYALPQAVTCSIHVHNTSHGSLAYGGIQNKLHNNRPATCASSSATLLTRSPASARGTPFKSKPPSCLQPGRPVPPLVRHVAADGEG